MTVNVLIEEEVWTTCLLFYEQRIFSISYHNKRVAKSITYSLPRDNLAKNPYTQRKKRRRRNGRSPQRFSASKASKRKKHRILILPNRSAGAVIVTRRSHSSLASIQRSLSKGKEQRGKVETSRCYDHSRTIQRTSILLLLLLCVQSSNYPRPIDPFSP